MARERIAVPKRRPERRPELVEGPVEGRRFFYGWVILFVSFVGHFLVTGSRATFSIFVKPLTDEFGWSRASISLAMSFHTFFQGLFQPFIGRLVDDFGPKRVLAIGIGLMGMALAGLAPMNNIWFLYLLYGLVAALGFGAGGQVSHASLIARWFRRRRGLAIALSSTGSSLGQLLIIPLTMTVILALGWRTAYSAMGLVLLLVAVPLVWLLIRDTPQQMGLAPDGELPEKDNPHPVPSSGSGLVVPEARLTLREIVTTRTFLLLTSGFFICGFTVNLVLTHLAPFGHEHGMGEMAAAGAVGLTGASSLVGGLVTGALSDRYGRKNPLAAVYLIRGVGLLVFVFGSGDASFYGASLLYGFSAVVPGTLAPALLADNFGVHTMGTLFGLILLGHQVVGALSSYLGGAIFDATGSYYGIFLPTAVATFVGAGLIFLIKEKRAF